MFQMAPRHPEMMNPAIIGGVVKGMFVPFAIGRRPSTVTNQLSPPKIIGERANGIIKIGFKTIGIPKIKGSLMLNRLGAIASLPIVLSCFDLAK